MIPQSDSSSTEMDVSLLLLQHGRGLSDIPISQVSSLETNGQAKDETGQYKAISYQDFLEKIFLVDLALVV